MGRGAEMEVSSFFLGIPDKSLSSSGINMQFTSAGQLSLKEGLSFHVNGACRQSSCAGKTTHEKIGAHSQQHSKAFIDLRAS
jgi:hypothetical protein